MQKVVCTMGDSELILLVPSHVKLRVGESIGVVAGGDEPMELWRMDGDRCVERLCEWEDTLQVLPIHG